jgi:hypothetical protein
MIRANVTRPLGRMFSIFAEVGYRYLKTAELDTSAAAGVNGGVSFLNAANLYQFRAIDVSGPFIDAGAGVHF